mmetsp:Transcript_6673/g.21858  ORF Transcript_6673/g.21858 Transcript_6673/m.21858 type:complete len:227 (-) Transcript_6673:787-1467(-)
MATTPDGAAGGRWVVCGATMLRIGVIGTGVNGARAGVCDGSAKARSLKPPPCDWEAGGGRIRTWTLDPGGPTDVGARGGRTLAPTSGVRGAMRAGVSAVGAAIGPALRYAIGAVSSSSGTKVPGAPKFGNGTVSSSSAPAILGVVAAAAACGCNKSAVSSSPGRALAVAAPVADIGGSSASSMAPSGGIRIDPGDVSSRGPSHSCPSLSRLELASSLVVGTADSAG